MEKGVYCLVLANVPTEARVGALGTRSFQGGWHVYAGSALGPGGLARVTRHIAFSRERSRTRRWHIDYLLGDPSFSLIAAICGPTRQRLECELARGLPGEPVPGFGCSDCRCKSHLFYVPTDPVPGILSHMRSLSLEPVITTINTMEGQS